ncbi:MAG: CHAP domain-containing protein [Oscillospiraceae bacterium]
MKKKFICFTTSAIMLLSFGTLNPKFLPSPVIVEAAYENTWANTGNQREDIVKVAETQIGYHEGANNDTKYNRWNGTISGYPVDGYGYPWCQCFVSWCANQAGIATDIIPRTAGTYVGRDFFVKQGTFEKGRAYGGNYTPRRGDIIYYTSDGAGPCHVGIVSDCNGSAVYAIEGNYSDKVGTRSISISDSYILGYGVPNYDGVIVSAPTYGILSADKVKIGLNEEITFTASSDYATNYTIGVDNSEGRYLTENMKGNTITLKFDKTGSYGAYVTAYNSQGYCDSAWIGFTVYDDKPSESVLTCNKSVVAVGEEIVFSASSDETATGYCIGVNKNDTRVVTENMTDGKISLSFDEPGNYGAYVTAWNDYGYFDSNWISFSVYNSKPTYSKLNSNRTVAEVGEPILFTAESEFATGCTIGIDYWTYGEETKVERIITESMNNRKFECKFDKPGSYSAYVTSYNDFGGIDSKNIFFTVTDSKPTTSTLSSSANKLVIGEEIEFYALSDLATSYWIGIDYNKKRYLTEEMVNGKFKCSFTEPGEYKAYVTSSNKYGGVDSECIVFRVYETDDEKNYNGDCNADGKINAADLVMLQQYMFDSEVEIPDCQAIDLSKDDIINIVDYIMLKNLLVSP